MSIFQDKLSYLSFGDLDLGDLERGEPDLGEPFDGVPALGDPVLGDVDLPFLDGLTGASGAFLLGFITGLVSELPEEPSTTDEELEDLDWDSF